MKTYYVYILANRKQGTLCVGVTNDLVRRVHEHKMETADGFTKRYGVKTLVWFDTTSDIEGAISAEKRIKRWPGRYKFNVIEEKNPDWLDLFDELTGRMDPGTRPG